MSDKTIYIGIDPDAGGFSVHPIISMPIQTALSPPFSPLPTIIGVEQHKHIPLVLALLPVNATVIMIDCDRYKAQ